ncbi:MAG TPA: hypothetical protein VHX49_00680 [Candidatus Acidoferrales bacterium]|jgi:hypothetical protein|nr:hypothetical protein [Candidatus Acidoferrales bacterium]
MLRTGKFGTWTVVAALTMAVLYGSFCSTACAVAALPMGKMSSHCEKCDRARHSGPSHQNQAPADHNCGRHVHPTDFLQAAGAPDLHSPAVSSANLVAALSLDLRASDFGATMPLASGLAPPGRLQTPLPQKLSVLRI